MLATLILACTIAPTHLVGEGGLISPPVLTYMVGRQSDDLRRPVHGQFPWEYGLGVEELLDEGLRQELLELRQKRVGLSIGAAACVLGGSALSFLGLYLTPSFISVYQPDAGGLTIPIILGVLGLLTQGVAIPLTMFRPGDYEIETLVHSYNSNHEGSEKILLLHELVGETLLTLSATGPRGQSAQSDQPSPSKQSDPSN